MAGIYSVLRDKEQAFAWLEKIYLARSNGMPAFGVDPRIGPLRGDPRFADLLRRIGFPNKHCSMVFGFSESKPRLRNSVRPIAKKRNEAGLRLRDRHPSKPRVRVEPNKFAAM